MHQTQSIITHEGDATGEALTLAVELTQIREIYGEECFGTVQRALATTGSDWRQVVMEAVHAWESTSMRSHLDPML